MFDYMNYSSCLSITDLNFSSTFIDSEILLLYNLYKGGL
jgi:hypothetical protein